MKHIAIIASLVIGLAGLIIGVEKTHSNECDLKIIHAYRIRGDQCGYCLTRLRGDDLSQFHFTPFRDGRSIFCICEKCFNQLTPTQRVPYYRIPFDLPDWGWKEEDWSYVRKAVLEGK